MKNTKYLVESLVDNCLNGRVYEGFNSPLSLLKDLYKPHKISIQRCNNLNANFCVTDMYNTNKKWYYRISREYNYKNLPNNNGINCTNMFYTKNNTINLLHGSGERIEKPFYMGSESSNDYGNGFYTVSEQNYSLAAEWACSFYNNKFYRKIGFVNKYVFNTQGLSILNLDKYDIIYWVVLTATYRNTNVDKSLISKLQEKYLIDISQFDCIYGWRCDDTYSNIINNFFTGLFTVDALKEAVHLGLLKEQFVLISNLAYNHIQFIGADVIKGQNFTEYSKRFDKRKVEADKGIYFCADKYSSGKRIRSYIGD